jgi:hypothetical protein
LEARDKGCTVPGCDTPPDRCETDHRVPFNPDQPAIGQTTASNTRLLCKTHHQLKTHHHWEYNKQPGTGQTIVTTPNSSS